MDIFEKILKEAERASKEQELPDALLEQIREICKLRKHSDEKDILEDLYDRLFDYEPFADVGCGNESYSTADVQKVVDLLYEF